MAAAGGIGIAMFFFLKNRKASARVAERFIGLYTVLRSRADVDEIDTRPSFSRPDRR